MQSIRAPGHSVFREGGAPEASHRVKLELDVVVLCDLVCSALTTPVVSYSLQLWGLQRGLDSTLLSQLGDPALA